MFVFQLPLPLVLEKSQLMFGHMMTPLRNLSRPGFSWRIKLEEILLLWYVLIVLIHYFNSCNFQKPKVLAIFDSLRNYLWTAAGKPEPSEADAQKMLAPIINLLNEINAFKDTKRNTAQWNHLNSIAEALPALGWLTVVCQPFFLKSNDLCFRKRPQRHTWRSTLKPRNSTSIQFSGNSKKLIHDMLSGLRLGSRYSKRCKSLCDKSTPLDLSGTVPREALHRALLLQLLHQRQKAQEDHHHRHHHQSQLISSLALPHHQWTLTKLTVTLSSLLSTREKISLQSWKRLQLICRPTRTRTSVQMQLFRRLLREEQLDRLRRLLLQWESHQTRSWRTESSGLWWVFSKIRQISSFLFAGVLRQRPKHCHRCQRQEANCLRVPLWELCHQNQRKSQLNHFGRMQEDINCFWRPCCSMRDRQLPICPNSGTAWNHGFFSSKIRIFRLSESYQRFRSKRPTGARSTCQRLLRVAKLSLPSRARWTFRFKPAMTENT